MDREYNTNNVKKRGVTYEHMTAVLSFLIGILITRDLFIVNYFNYTNIVQKILTAILSVLVIYTIIYSTCDYLVKTNKR